MDVAAAARVSTAYLSEVERGRKEASSEVLAAVCGALGLRLVDLVARTGEELRPLAPVRVLSSARERVPSPRRGTSRRWANPCETSPSPRRSAVRPRAPATSCSSRPERRSPPHRTACRAEAGHRARRYRRSMTEPQTAHGTAAQDVPALQDLVDDAAFLSTSTSSTCRTSTATTPGPPT